jgi:hypothetical protein
MKFETVDAYQLMCQRCILTDVKRWDKRFLLFHNSANKLKKMPQPAPTSWGMHE